ncbi:MAG: PGF-pre-PGF domain-containing protein [Methanophagales archaeon]|nr:PGF-pre-PGF domain-containing protein [Methanophagales archaeon]
MIKKKMKEKSVKYERAMLVALLVISITLFLGGIAAVSAVTHTEVASVTRYAPAGPGAGEEFVVKLTISGELPLVVGIVETIPEGFSFVSATHPMDQYSVSGQKIAFAAINVTSIKYTVMAPSLGKGTFTGKWIDMLSEKEGSIEDTLIEVGGGGAGAIEEEVTATTTPTPYVPTVTKATRSIPVMEAGKEIATTFKDMDVSMIALKADKNVSDVKVVVEKIERTPDIPEPSGISYTYLDISVENVGSAIIEGKIEFKVGKWWISNNNIDEATVKLNRYDGTEGWKMLPTTKVGEDDDFVYFEAQTPGFSMFAVTGRKKVEVEVEAAANPTPTIAVPTPAATATPATTPTEEVPGFEVFFAAVSLLIAYLIVFRGGDKE